MAKLIYSAITSLDGYVADEHGKFGWAAPSDEVHAFVNDLERGVGTYLYGRRMYEVMQYWETVPAAGGDSRVMLDYAKIWQAAEKVVFSRTLSEPSSAKTRIERRFDAEAVTRMKSDQSRDISVGGAQLAAEAMRAGVVDEMHLFLTPIIIGAGTSALPHGVLAKLALLDERRFGNGVVHLHYRVER